MMTKFKEEREQAEKMMDSINQSQEPPADNPAQGEDDSHDDSQAANQNTDNAPPETSHEVDQLKAEIERLKAQLDDENNQTFRSQALLFKSQRETARDEIRELKKQIKEMQEQPAPRKQVKGNEAPDTDDEDYQVLVEEYGEKAAKAMWRVAQAGKISADEVTRMVEEKTKPVTETLETVKKTQAVSEEERFFAALSTKVPDWETIQGGNGKAQDPKFTAFLKGQVPFQDYSYDDLIQHYFQHGNVLKVAEIFNAFKAQNKPATPKQNELEKLIEPNKTNRGIDAPKDDKKPVFTRQEIEDFDRKKRNGTLYGWTPDQIQAKSKAYQEAIMEGRTR